MPTSARGPLPKTGKDTTWKATVTKIDCLRRERSPCLLQCLSAAAPRWRPRLRGGRGGGRVGTRGGLLLYFSPGTKVTNEGTPERGSCHPSSSLHATHMWRQRVAVEVSSPYSPCFFLSFLIPLSSLCYTHRTPPRPASRHAVPHSRKAWRLLRHDHHRRAAPPSRRLTRRCMYLAGVADHRARPLPAREAASAQTGCAGRGLAAVAAQKLGQRRAPVPRAGTPTPSERAGRAGCRPPPAAILRGGGARHDCKEASMGPSSDG